MQELRPRTIYPGHGPIVVDAGAKLREYVAHRAEREEQVLAGLAAGDRTVAKLVERIYADYPSDVHALAARSVMAHLRKLEREGAGGQGGPRCVADVDGCRAHGVPRCGRPVRGRARYCGPCSLALLQGEASTP